MKIAMGADHGGFSLKEIIKKHLVEAGHEVLDLGTHDTSSCNYPVYAEKVAYAVKDKEADLGVLICGTGIGMSIAANKVKGIRAAAVSDCFTAQATREHNDSNIICLGDCAGIPTSKTSAAIRKQLPVATANLVSLMEGGAPDVKYNGYAACPIVTEYGKVLMCEFDYDKKPQITFPLSLIDMSRERWVAWLLKVYGLKPIYFELMLRGLY